MSKISSPKIKKKDKVKKNKKKNLSDRIAATTKGRKEEESTAKNAFEFKYAHQKHAVLGGKSASSASAVQTGAPAQSRQRALEQRTGTLRHQLHTWNKHNQLNDRRVPDDRRLMAEHMHKMKKEARKGRYRLADEPDAEETAAFLTHHGQAITDIEAKHKPIKDTGAPEMSAEFVSRAHFGGFDDDAEPVNANLIGIGPTADDGQQTPAERRKAAIDDLIAQSKMNKYNMSVTKEKQVDTTDALDQQWNDLLKSGALGEMMSNVKKEKSDAAGKDSYDKNYRLLQVDRQRAEATDRVKTEAELASERKKQLEQLEAARIERMKPSLTGSGASSLKQPTEPFVAAYKDGKLIDPTSARKSKKRVHFSPEPEDDDQQSSDEEDQDEEDEDESSASELTDELQMFTPQVDEDDAVSGEQSSESQQPSLDADIPFVLDMPASYAKFCQLMNGCPPSKQSVVLERLLACHHPSLAADNKRRLHSLFLYQLRYLDNTCVRLGRAAGVTADDDDVRTLLLLTQALWAVAQAGHCNNLRCDLQQVPTASARCVRALLNQHYGQARLHRHRWLALRQLALCQLVPRLYTTSDHWHPAVAPAHLLIAHTLANAHCRSAVDIARGLYVCELLVDEYLAGAGYYSGECLAFVLQALCAAASQPQPGCTLDTLPLPPHSQLLLVDKKAHQLTPQCPELLECFTGGSIEPTDVVRLGCVHKALQLTRRLSEVYSRLASYSALFALFSRTLKQLPADCYPQPLRTLLADVMGELERTCVARSQQTPLHRAVDDSSAVITEFLEPRIETNFDPERPHKKSAGRTEKSERSKLRHKVKSETRGAIRELRRDAAFVAHERARGERQQDTHRRQKTQQIMRSLSGQEAEYKHMIKTKDTMKKRGIK